ncbi:triose-phosphate isomerase [Vreelandella malpeensis]|uniref:Triosephosphate isomerase n=1 Tax=Vreelandella malpeensis TaxID=1172368 RepID=A0ABS8DS65_9GAMM|nr:triose-phosphate isomerase [Halomonas malpeensis]MCB8889124.1 triose-phosphate isomerase [Halomonas malpeensis]
MRTLLIAGNWKMNGSKALLDAFASAFAPPALADRVEVAMIVPFPYLDAARRAFESTPLKLGAQTLNPEASGAHTGEVSASMLGECGVTYVLVGHSERRALYGETDADVLARAKTALENDLTPILCVGETLEEREAGRTMDVVLAQVEAVLSPLAPTARQRLVIAYEPVWAIGTGRTATPEQAQEVMAGIRGYLARLDTTLAEGMVLLYGGSMNAGNAAELLAKPDIDGGLVGGASLKTDDFLAICQSAG